MMFWSRFISVVTPLLLVALLGYAAVIHWHVKKPRRYTCPQCHGKRAVATPAAKGSKSLTQLRCPYCGGSGEVWR